MKLTKIKRYRIGISKQYPTTHTKQGISTYFSEKIQLARCKQNGVLNPVMYADDMTFIADLKFHTIRKNYQLWEHRIKEVQAGMAVLELFYWEGKPYRSKQIVFSTLDKSSGCGIQQILFINKDINQIAISNASFGFLYRKIQDVATNDGLSVEDFKEWFKKYDLSKPMACIQFTNFRY